MDGTAALLGKVSMSIMRFCYLEPAVHHGALRCIAVHFSRFPKNSSKKFKCQFTFFFAFDGKIQGKFVVLSFKTKENKLVMNLMSMLNILNASLSTV